MSGTDQPFRDAGVATVSVVVTWLVFSATVSLLVVSDAVDTALPVQLSEWGRDYAIESIGFLDVFWRTLVLWPLRLQGPGSPWPTVEPVLETAPVTLQLLTTSVGVAVTVALPVIVLAHALEAPRAAAALGLLASVPSVALLFVLHRFVTDPFEPVEAGQFGALLPPAVALGLPLGLGVARLANWAGHTDAKRNARNLLLEGWLYVLWLPGALLVTESFFRVRGVTTLLSNPLQIPTLPHLLQGFTVFVAPVIAAAYYRDIVLAFIEPGSADGPRESSTATATDGGLAPVGRPLVAALRDSRTVQIGVGGLVTALLVGFVGSLSLAGRAGQSGGPSFNEAGAGPSLAVVTDGLWVTAGTTVVALLVATVVGLGLGVASARRPDRRLVPRLLDPVGHVPSVVLLLGLLLLFAPLGGLLVIPLFGTAGGLAVCPVVARRYCYGVRDGDHQSPALGAVAIATTGAGLTTVAVVQVALTFPGVGELSTFPLAYTLPSLAVALLVIVGLPVAAAFLVGEGLRWYAATT